LKIKKRNFNYCSELFVPFGFVAADRFQMGCDALYLGSYGAMSWVVVVTTHRP